MSEVEPRPQTEELQPVTIELRTQVAQEAMLHALNGQLMTNTLAEIRSTGEHLDRLVEENQTLRPIFKTLAKNLGRELGANDWLFLGIIDEIPLEQMEEWSTPTDHPGYIFVFANYFIEQKRQQVQQEHTTNKPNIEPPQ